MAYGLFAATDLWLAAWVAQDGVSVETCQTPQELSDTLSLFGHAFLVLTLSSWDTYSISKLAKQFMVIAWINSWHRVRGIRYVFIHIVPQKTETLIKNKHRYTERKNPVKIHGDLS